MIMMPSDDNNITRAQGVGKKWEVGTPPATRWESRPGDARSGREWERDIRHVGSEEMGQ